MAEREPTSEAISSRNKGSKKRGLRALTAGLVLAGSLHGVALNQQQIHYEKANTSISKTLETTLDNYIPPYGVVIDFDRKREEKVLASPTDLLPKKFTSNPIYEQSRERQYRNAKERLSPTSSTREYIDFFNRFYEQEGLPEDWQKLQYGDAQVGFSINRQIMIVPRN